MAHHVTVNMDDSGRLSATVQTSAENHYSLGMDTVGKELAKLQHNYAAEQRSLLKTDLKKEIEDANG